MYTVKKLYVYTETLVKVKDTLVKKQDTKKKIKYAQHICYNNNQSLH